MQAEASSGGCNNDVGHTTHPDPADDVVEPGAKKFKASEPQQPLDPDAYDDIYVNWVADGLGLPVEDMEVDEAKENQRIDNDWNEFAADLGELPVQLQEALMAKREHFEKIQRARVKPY